MGQCCYAPSGRAEERYKADGQQQRNRNIELTRQVNSQPVAQTNAPQNSHQHPVSPRQVMAPPAYGDVNRNSSVPMVRAIYPYTKKYDDDISFGKGERLQLINRTAGDWWLVRKSDGTEGYVPSNYVKLDEDSPLSHDAFMQVPRREAEQKLLLPGTQRGTYLIRPCSDQVAIAALSVRDVDQSQQLPIVRHYKVRRLDNNRGYYVAPQLTFPSFNQLITYYMQNDNTGLCTRLTSICPSNYQPSPNIKDFECPRAAIKLIQKLGGGAFGDVWLAKLHGVYEVAVKSLQEKYSTNEGYKHKFVEEAKIMHKLSHPKIVRLLGMCTDTPPMYIITELMRNGALSDYLAKKGPRELPHRTLIDMIAQIADGMSYLEEQHCIHRDLRAANILVGDHNEVKVSDFGLSKIEDTYQIQPDTQFPVRWTAPEAISHKVYTIKSDIWSFGILIYEIITYGSTPYPGKTNSQVLQDTMRGIRMENPAGNPITPAASIGGGSSNGSNGGPRFARQEPVYTVECSPQLYQVMLDCWAANPEQRPTFQFLSSFFDSFETAAGPHYQ